MPTDKPDPIVINVADFPPETVWHFVFDEPEAKGTVIVEPGVYGLHLGVDGYKDGFPVAQIDLFYMSVAGQNSIEPLCHGNPQVVVYCPERQDTLALARMTPDGARLILGGGVRKLDVPGVSDIVYGYDNSDLEKE